MENFLELVCLARHRNGFSVGILHLPFLIGDTSLNDILNLQVENMITKIGHNH